MKKKYIFLIICVVVVIGISFYLSYRSESPKEALETLHGKIDVIAEEPFNDDSLAIFFTSYENGKHYFNLEVVRSSTSLGKKWWKRSPFVNAFSAEDMLSSNFVSGNPREEGYGMRLDETHYVRWGIALDMADMNYQINGLDLICADIYLDNQHFVLFYVMGDESLANAQVTHL